MRWLNDPFIIHIYEVTLKSVMVIKWTIDPFFLENSPLLWDSSSGNDEIKEIKALYDILNYIL
ncbi:hypothetical protein GCM10007162_10790 [Ignatzschineria ureiclastica]|nr:hypothetical protein GCM10007162_10790 [Ignatzschineria ureiclastica]